MKKQLFLILLFLISANSYSQTALDIQKAKAASKAYLVKKLNNPGSYAPVKWQKLEKTYTDFEVSMTAKIIDDSLNYYNEAKSNIGDELHRIRMKSISNYSKDSTYAFYIDLDKQVDSAIESLTNQRVRKENLFKPVFDGYMIEHTFRARNKFNALILQNYVFFLNKAFKVTSASDIDQMERERENLQRRIDELTGGN